MTFLTRWRDDATGRWLPAAVASKLSRALVSLVRLRRKPRAALRKPAAGYPPETGDEGAVERTIDQTRPPE